MISLVEHKRYFIALGPGFASTRHFYDRLYCFQLSDVVFIMLINDIVGILTFMSMINFMLS